MKVLKKLLYLFLLALFISLALVLWSQHVVKRDSAAYLFESDSIHSMPGFKCGLLLGTIDKLGSNDNPFFTYRIDAAVKLYKSGKIKYLILSGDNSVKGYDEPEMMKQALMARGVPDSVLYCDYAGFRTFDSVVRCSEVFGQNRFLIISQRFHNERAVFLARSKGLDAFAYNAREVTGKLGKSTMQREYLARVNAWLDLNILGTDPKFLGEKIEIR